MILRGVLLFFFVLIAIHTFKTLYLFGYFKTIHNHYPGPCRVIPGVEPGSEDVTVASNGLAFISSGQRVTVNRHDPSTYPPLLKGRIFLFDFNNPEKNAVEVAFTGDFDKDNFYPIGISLYEDSTSGERRLFVVNYHISNENRIEIFRFNESSTSLHHLKTITGENLYSVNDLHAVGPETFYYTNDLYFTRPRHFAVQMEIYSGLAWGTVGLYSNGKDRILASGYRYPDGVNSSPDGRYLYVAAFIPGELLIFKREDDNSIEEIKRVKLHTSIDNIEVDKQTGDLWIGCNPIAYFALHRGGTPPGSQVLRLRFSDKETPFANIDVREVLMDDGSLVKGSSVASYYDNKMLVGTVFDKLAYCELEAF